eukprot:1136685-Pelagomonas_calceolata.AAC.4
MLMNKAIKGGLSVRCQLPLRRQLCPTPTLSSGKRCVSKAQPKERSPEPTGHVEHTHMDMVSMVEGHTARAWRGPRVQLSKVLYLKPELHACASTSSTSARTTNVLLACAMLQQLAVETLLASIEEKRILRAKAPCFPFTKREINGDQEGYEQHHSISVVRVERSEPNQSKS